MSLGDYLNKYFPNGQYGEFEGEKVEMISHFFDKFGVNVKIEGPRFLFKYDQLAAKFAIPLTSECRGHIWYNADGKWERLSNPWDKFHNLHEGFCPLFGQKNFKDGNSYYLLSKEDGTAIQVFYDRFAGEWKATTLGMINPGNVQDCNFTFGDLFWKTLPVSKDLFLSKLDKDYTYLFELCCRENRVVSSYKKNKIFILSIRHTHLGTYLPPVLDPSISMIESPKSLFFYEKDIVTDEDLIRFVNDKSNYSQDVEFPEGFVVYRAGVPIAKVKNDEYLRLHAVGGGDLKHTRNVVVEAFFLNKVDDIYAVLHDSMKAFIETLKERSIAFSSDIANAYEAIRGKKFDTPKDFALWVQKAVDKKYHPFFYMNKEWMMAGTVRDDIRELVTDWLKDNWKKYEDHWKAE